MCARLFCWTIICLTLTLSGCCAHCQQKRTCAPTGETEITENRLLPVNRGAIEIELDKLPNPSSIAGLLPGPDGSQQYWALSEHDCLCQAAASSNVGNLLAGEGEAKKKKARKRSGCNGDLRQNIFFYLVEEARSQSAGAALDLYYRLAEAEAKWDLLRTSLEVAEEAHKEIRKIREQSLKVTPELETLERQWLELQADQLKLRGAILKLNSQLAALLGVDGNQGLIWPTADLAVTELAIEPEGAVGIGLGQRPQLLMLREVSAGLNEQNLPLVRQLLQSVNPMLGVIAKVEHPCLGWLLCLGKMCAILHPCKESNDLPTRRTQIDRLLRDREKAVAEEIRQAAHNLLLQTQLVAVAKQRGLQRREKFRELEDRRQKGLVSLLETAPAHLAWLQAHGQIIEEVMAWHSARVRLKLAQGVLIQECEDNQPDTVTIWRSCRCGQRREK